MRKIISVWGGKQQAYSDFSNNRRKVENLDKYSGMRSFDFAITPNVLICGVAGTVLGVILAYWGTSDLGIVAATAIAFGILSVIFRIFIQLWEPQQVVPG